MRVLVFGTFDLLHPGHLFLLKEAQKRGAVSVIVARDHNVQRIKGFHTHQSESERAQAIHSVFPNVHVRLGDANDFLAPVREIDPDLILLGYDQTLPPGISTAALHKLTKRIERLPPHEPHRFKSSLERARRTQE